MEAKAQLLQPTRLLDFTHPAIEALVEKRGWRPLPMYDRIGAVYDFVRNEIAFGYNAGNELPASAVLADGTAITVMMLDLDRLKPINAAQGHDAGDVVLRALAERLQAQIRHMSLIHL